MTCRIWTRGRFSWWFVGFVLLLTGLWLSTDIAWRVVTLPFETFVPLATAVVILAIAGYLLSWRRWG